MLKTRYEILEIDHDSALTQLVENEINLKMLEESSKGLKPGKEFDEITNLIESKKTNIKRIKTIIKIIEKMIEEEKK